MNIPRLPCKPKTSLILGTLLQTSVCSKLFFFLNYHHNHRDPWKIICLLQNLSLWWFYMYISFACFCHVLVLFYSFKNITSFFFSTEKGNCLMEKVASFFSTFWKRELLFNDDYMSCMWDIYHSIAVDKSIFFPLYYTVAIR